MARRRKKQKLTLEELLNRKYQRGRELRSFKVVLRHCCKYVIAAFYDETKERCRNVKIALNNYEQAVRSCQNKDPSRAIDYIIEFEWIKRETLDDLRNADIAIKNFENGTNTPIPQPTVMELFLRRHMYFKAEQPPNVAYTEFLFELHDLYERAHVSSMTPEDIKIFVMIN